MQLQRGFMYKADATAGEVIETTISFMQALAQAPQAVAVFTMEQKNCASIVADRITSYGFRLCITAAADGMCEWEGEFGVPEPPQMRVDGTLFVHPALGASVPVADFSTLPGESIVKYTDGATPFQFINEFPAWKFGAKKGEYIRYQELGIGTAKSAPPDVKPLAAYYLGGLDALRGLPVAPAQWWLDARAACVDRLATILGIPADFFTDERRGAIDAALEDLRAVVEEHGE